MQKKIQQEKMCCRMGKSIMKCLKAFASEQTESGHMSVNVEQQEKERTKKPKLYKRRTECLEQTEK